MVEAVNLGDVILTRKPHPCGGSEWTVTRTGADIKIKCNTCGRVVMLDRERFLRQRKALVRPGGFSENPENPGKTEKPENPENPENLGKTEKPENPENPGKTEKTENPGKTENPERQNMEAEK